MQSHGDSSSELMLELDLLRAENNALRKIVATMLSPTVVNAEDKSELVVCQLCMGTDVDSLMRLRSSATHEEAEKSEDVTEVLPFTLHEEVDSQQEDLFDASAQKSVSRGGNVAVSPYFDPSLATPPPQRRAPASSSARRATEISQPDKQLPTGSRSTTIQRTQRASTKLSSYVEKEQLRKELAARNRNLSIMVGSPAVL